MPRFKTNHPKSLWTGFGHALKARRLEAKMSRTDLARKAGMTAKTAPCSIGRLEREENDPTWSVVIGLAQALGITPNDFLRP